MDLEFARMASLVDEKARQIRAREMIVGISSSVPLRYDIRTTDCAKTDEGNIEGDLSAALAGSEKPDPPNV